MYMPSCELNAWHARSEVGMDQLCCLKFTWVLRQDWHDYICCSIAIGSCYISDECAKVNNKGSSSECLEDCLHVAIFCPRLDLYPLCLTVPLVCVVLTLLPSGNVLLRPCMCCICSKWNPGRNFIPATLRECGMRPLRVPSSLDPSNWWKRELLVQKAAMHWWLCCHHIKGWYNA